LAVRVALSTLGLRRFRNAFCFAKNSPLGSF
jgi:hypothetical protein